MRPEGLSKLIKIIHFIGFRIRDLLACSAILNVDGRIIKVVGYESEECLQ
jgi:hypothetical protein